MNSLEETPDREWRFLTGSGDDPLRNLATEEAIARASEGIPTIRLWRNSPCVVIGRFQLLEAEVDQRACDRLQVPVYRRFSGGGAVYHDLRNINISVIMPRKHALIRRNPAGLRAPGVYALLLEPLAKAVAALGFEATLSERGMLIGVRKVSGVAAWFGIDTILVHGTLLVASDIERLECVLRGPGAFGNHQWEQTKSHRAEVTSLAKEGLVHESTDRVADEVIATFAKHFDTQLTCGALTPTEKALAEDLLANKYSQSAWHAKGESREMTARVKTVAPTLHPFSTY